MSRFIIFNKLTTSNNPKVYEKVYQKALERKYGYGHKRLPCGITDITTPDKHIEIKRWSQNKQAIGQLLAYNYYDEKNILEAHLFGEYPVEKKEIAKKIFKLYNIVVVDLNMEI